MKISLLRKVFAITETAAADPAIDCETRKIFREIADLVWDACGRDDELEEPDANPSVGNGYHAGGAG